MPTPTGRPRKGEQIFTADGTLIGTVISVSRTKEYSVTIKPPKSKFQRTITAFPNWAKRHNWKVA